MKKGFGRFNKAEIEVADGVNDDFYASLEFQAKNIDFPKKLLTKRQSECLALAAFGFNNPEIGKILIVSESTAKKTLIDTFRRLKTNNRTNAVTLGFIYGILTVETLNEIYIRYNLKDKLHQEDEWW